MPYGMLLKEKAPSGVLAMDWPPEAAVTPMSETVASPTGFPVCLSTMLPLIVPGPVFWPKVRIAEKIRQRARKGKW